MPRDDSDRRIDDLLEQVELSAAPSQPVGQYSRGMRQRLGLADVLLKQPQLVILDDPTLGLDPAGVNWLLQLIKEMSDEQGITVIHILPPPPRSAADMQPSRDNVPREDGVGGTGGRAYEPTGRRLSTRLGSGQSDATVVGSAEGAADGRAVRGRWGI